MSVRVKSGRLAWDFVQMGVNSRAPSLSNREEMLFLGDDGD